MADRRCLSKEERLDEILPRLQDTVGEFVFGQLKREVRCNYVQLVSELKSSYRVFLLRRKHMVHSLAIVIRRQMSLLKNVHQSLNVCTIMPTLTEMRTLGEKTC